MGQAKRRKEQLGDLYGAPKGDSSFPAYSTSKQRKLDEKGLQMIRSALKAGQPVLLVGTVASRPLAKAAGLPWLHELPLNTPIPKSLAWDMEIAEQGGPVLPSGHTTPDTLLILGAGTAKWMEGYL